MKLIKPLIICYHRINDKNESYLRPTKVADLEKQMSYLSKAFNPVSLESITQYIQERTSLPPKAISVTFDDGYRDNYENAYPILRRYGVPATIFLTTSFIGNGEIPAWDKKYYKSKRELMLSWEQVKEMSENGISFGSHTLTHPILSKISRKQMQKEIHLSKEIIEQKTGKVVTSFAYPGGDFNSCIEEIVQEAGYSTAVSTIPGSNNTSSNLYALKRNVIQLKNVYHKLFPISYLAEITGMIGHLRFLYYKMKSF